MTSLLSVAKRWVVGFVWERFFYTREQEVRGVSILDTIRTSSPLVFIILWTPWLGKFCQWLSGEEGGEHVVWTSCCCLTSAASWHLEKVRLQLCYNHDESRLDNVSYQSLFQSKQSIKFEVKYQILQKIFIIVLVLELHYKMKYNIWIVKVLIFLAMPLFVWVHDKGHLNRRGLCKVVTRVSKVNTNSSKVHR